MILADICQSLRYVDKLSYENQAVRRSQKKFMQGDKIRAKKKAKKAMQLQNKSVDKQWAK